MTTNPSSGLAPVSVREAVVEIKVRDDGPYKVSGPVRVLDATGRELLIPAGESLALCRCGESRDKPFCDGSHKRSGFSSCVRAAAG